MRRSVLAAATAATAVVLGGAVEVATLARAADGSSAPTPTPVPMPTVLPRPNATPVPPASRRRVGDRVPYPEAMPSYEPMSMRLETERLTLRPWAESDVDDYRALVAERDGRARPGEGLLTADDARERIRTQLAATARTGIALLPVCRRVEGDFIGYCGLIVGRSTVDEPEIAYELFRHAHGRGYATEAARAVLAAATATGRSRLWSTVRSWNAPSFRVLHKLGFERHHVTSEDDGADVVWLTRALP